MFLSPFSSPCCCHSCPLPVVILISACHPLFLYSCCCHFPWCHLPIPIPIVVVPCSLSPLPHDLAPAIHPASSCLQPWLWCYCVGGGGGGCHCHCHGGRGPVACCSPVPHCLIIFSLAIVVSFLFSHCFVSLLSISLFLLLIICAIHPARGLQVSGRAVLSSLLSSAA